MAEPLKKPEDEGEGEGELPEGTPLQIAGCLYLMMLAAALIWLWAGDRMDSLAESALGDYGIWVAAGVGLGGGLLGALLLGFASHLKSVQSYTERIATLLGPLSENQILALSILSAVAEELFFRLALQGAFGMAVAVGVYTGLNTGPGFWRSAWIALFAGLLFSGMVELGFGLLSATTAHAIINYLSLRRILPT